MDNWRATSDTSTLPTQGIGCCGNISGGPMQGTTNVSFPAGPPDLDLVANPKARCAIALFTESRCVQGKVPPSEP